MKPGQPILADLPETALWSDRSWPEFARTTARKRQGTVVVLPLFGFADWGLGRPFDLEEVLGAAVLRVALADRATAARTIVLPPLRFVHAPYPNAIFGLDLETTLALVDEIAGGVAGAGFTRLVLFNSGPWNEEPATVAACDARVAQRLLTIVINLASLGLDLHPVRSENRTAVQSAACECLACLPDRDSPPGDVSLPGFRPGNIRQPAPLPFAKTLDEARAEGRAILAAAGAKLATLFAQVAKAPLPRKAKGRA